MSTLNVVSMNKPLKTEFKLYFTSLLCFFISATWLCVWPAQLVAIFWQRISLTSFIFSPEYQQAFLMSFLKACSQSLCKVWPILVLAWTRDKNVCYSQLFTVISLCSLTSLSPCFSYVQLACHTGSTISEDSISLGSIPAYRATIISLSTSPTLILEARSLTTGKF